MSEEQMQGSETPRDPAPVHLEVMQILERGFELRHDGWLRKNGMSVNTQWMVPKWDCDSLQHVADALEERITEAQSNERLMQEMKDRVLRARAFVSSSATAATYQTLGQYRDALIEILFA